MEGNTTERKNGVIQFRFSEQILIKKNLAVKTGVHRFVILAGHLHCVQKLKVDFYLNFLKSIALIAFVCAFEMIVVVNDFDNFHYYIDVNFAAVQMNDFHDISDYYLINNDYNDVELGVRNYFDGRINRI